MPRQPKRPGFVTTAAVLLFSYGGLMLLCSFCGAAEMAMIVAAPNANAQGPFDVAGQERELAKRIPSYVVVSSCTHVFNLALGAAMIVAGIGALRLKPFARFVGSGAAAADILVTSLSGCYHVLVVFPVSERIAQEQLQNVPFNAAGLTGGVSWAVLIFLTVFTLVFCLLIIGFLNAKKSRDGFAGKFEPDPDEERLARFEAFNDGDDDFRPRSRPPQAPGDTGITGEPD